MSADRLPEDLSAWPKNPRELLGVAGNVDRTALRRAYAALLRQFNPEHFPEHFRRIREAYEVVLQQVEWQTDASEFDDDAPAPEPDPPPAGEMIAPRDSSQSPASVLRENPPAGPATQSDSARHQAAGRWRDDLDAIWNRAIQREPEAYRALVDKEAQFAGRRDLCLRLYWLLVAWPELDTSRTACDWLARGLRFSALGGPLAELYRREIDAEPTEAFSSRCTDLLASDAEPGRLADLLDWRWAAAERLDRDELILGDAERLRPLFRQSAEDAWARITLSAIDKLCWSRSPYYRSQAEAMWKELDQAPHLHTPLRYTLDQTESNLLIAENWATLDKEQGPGGELLRLARLSLIRQTDDLVPQALALLARLVVDDCEMIELFDRIGAASRHMLGQLGRLIGQCGGAEPDRPEFDARYFHRMNQVELEAEYGDNYLPMRPQLLRLCLREQLAPDTLAQAPSLVLVEPAAANTQLLRNLAADIPLRLCLLGPPSPRRRGVDRVSGRGQGSGIRGQGRRRVAGG